MSVYNWPLMKNSISLWDRFQLAKFVLTSDKFTQGENVERFENEWSKWLGCKYSLFVTSGSTANFLLVASIIEEYGLKSGDKVLLPSCTWVTNINPIIQLGLTPIFCDVNLENYSFDLENLKETFGAEVFKGLEEITADAGYGSEENYDYLEQSELTAYVKYNTFDPLVPFVRS